mgnify:CR=1 FL=1
MYKRQRDDGPVAGPAMPGAPPGDEAPAAAKLGAVETDDVQRVVLDQSFLPSHLRVKRSRPTKARAVAQLPGEVVEIHSKPAKPAPAPAAGDAEANFSDFLSEVRDL